jgi:hypothetical protein
VAKGIPAKLEREGFRLARWIIAAVEQTLRMNRSRIVAAIVSSVPVCSHRNASSLRFDQGFEDFKGNGGEPKFCQLEPRSRLLAATGGHSIACLNAG